MPTDELSRSPGDSADEVRKTNENTPIAQDEIHKDPLLAALLEGTDDQGQRTKLVRQVIEYEKRHSGPLPDPETLAAYEAIHPGAADRIFRMAEEQGSHRREIEAKIVEAEISDRKADRLEAYRGQWFGFGIGALAIIVGGATAVYGQPIVGGVISGGVILALVAAFINGRQSSATPSRPSQADAKTDPAKRSSSSANPKPT
jgi:uncharacterized membrane protein